MAKQINIEGLDVVIQKLQTATAAAAQLTQQLNAAGQAFGVVGGISSAAMPMSSPTMGAVGMAGGITNGTTSLSVPMNGSPGPPSASVFGSVNAASGMGGQDGFHWDSSGAGRWVRGPEEVPFGGVIAPANTGAGSGGAVTSGAIPRPASWGPALAGPGQLGAFAAVSPPEANTLAGSFAPVNGGSGRSGGPGGGSAGNSDLYPEVLALHEQINKAFPGGVSPPSGMPVLDQLKFGALRQEQNNINQTRQTIAGSLIYGGSQVAHAYTQATESGMPNPQGFASAYGTLIGSAAGALVGGFLGQPLVGAAFGGALGGSGAGAIMAPFVAHLNAANAIGGYAAATGQSADTLASGASRIADDANQRYRSAQFDADPNPFTRGLHQIQRDLGLYAGTDQTSNIHVAKIQASLRGAALEAGGMDVSRMEAYFESLGTIGPEAAQTAAKAVGALPSSGGNLFSLASKVGVVPVATMLQGMGRGAEVDAIKRGMAAAESANAVATGAGYMAQFGSDAYATSAYSGQSTRQRDPIFNRMIAGYQDQISAVESEMSAMEAVPGGANSPEHKAKAALKQSLYRKIAEEEGQRAQGYVGDSMAATGVNLAVDSRLSTSAGLYGGTGDIRRATSQTLADLHAGADELRGLMDTPGLTLADKRRMQSHINQMGERYMAAQAAGAGQEMRRGFMPFDLAIAAGGAEVAQESLYGTPESLRSAGGALVRNLTSASLASFTVASDPRLSAEDRQAANLRGYAQQQQAVQQQANIAGSALQLGSLPYGVAGAQAGAALTGASLYGSDAQLATAGAAVIGNLRAGSDYYGRAANDPNLSAADRANAQIKSAELSGQAVAAGASLRDSELGRDSMRAGLSNQAASNVLGRAAYGSGDDVRRASGGLIASLGDESMRIQGQIDKGGLSFEQDHRLRSRQLEISKQAFDVGQSAVDVGYSKDDMSGYGLRSVELSARRQIADLMPFGTGDRLSTSVLSIRNDQQQLGVLRQRERQLADSGNLSPERLFDIRQKEAGLAVDIARASASLSDGMENMLPVMSAGRPASYGLWDSMQLASLRYYRRGSAVASSGAINGRQAQQQMRAWDELSDGMVPHGPTSRTQGINSGFMGGNVETLLSQILAELRNGHGGRIGSSQRIGESSGQAFGMLAQRDVGQGYNGRRY